ncbi:hypothetical protein PCE1_000593 [Barthelona sp. PCE]
MFIPIFEVITDEINDDVVKLNIISAHPDFNTIPNTKLWFLRAYADMIVHENSKDLPWCLSQQISREDFRTHAYHNEKWAYQIMNQVISQIQLISSSHSKPDYPNFNDSLDTYDLEDFVDCVYIIKFANPSFVESLRKEALYYCFAVPD